jgi:hypothetical protein
MKLKDKDKEIVKVFETLRNEGKNKKKELKEF